MRNPGKVAAGVPRKGREKWCDQRALKVDMVAANKLPAA